MKLDLVKTGKYAAAVLAIAGAFALVDGRYQTAEAANQESVKRELGDVDTQIEITMLEIRYIKNKQVIDVDDEVKLEFLRTKLATLMTRQAQLRQR